MTTYRSALIGCGNIGSLYANDKKIKGIYTHVEAYHACPKTDLVAVCDINNERAQLCAGQWNVANYYDDVDLLLKEQNPDIVSICTSNDTHTSILEKVLHSPKIKGVIIEKPLGLDLDYAKKLVFYAKQKSVPLLVNYNRRYAEGHQEVKKIIDQGSIGQIQKVTGCYTKGILHNGTHWLDLARWLIGEIQWIKGVTHDTNYNTIDLPIDVLIGFENGATGFLQNLDAQQYSLFEMDIFGKKGRIRIVDSGHTIEFFDVVESPYYSGYLTLEKHDQKNGLVSDTLLNVVNDLVFCIDNNKKPICSGEDGLAVLQLACSVIGLKSVMHQASI